MENNKFLLPGAILVAGLLIGGALMYTRGPQANGPAGTNEPTKVATANIKPVTEADHILGNPNAKVVMVEYSDLECPFCKTFHTTLHRVIDTYGADGTVAWVYRHFAIPSLHPIAPKESEATECVAELGGNTKFWEYIDKLYSITPSNNGLDPAELPKQAVALGINETSFKTCMETERYKDAIATAYQDALAAGGQGTPYTVIITRSPLSDETAKQVRDMFVAAATAYGISPNQLGYVTEDKKVVLNGNLPYELIQQIIAALIA